MDDPIRMSDFPSWLLGQAAAHAYRLVSERLDAFGARGYHFRLLVTLVEHGPASQATLGRNTGIHVSDIVAALNELAADGFIERSPDPDDRRRNVITITTAGRRHLDRLNHAVAQAQQALLAPLTTAEREQFTSLLRRVLDDQQHGA
ncbi:MarR family winged helix-turn-helix transcriptional regulator [Dactylosporangium sucinum]|uniref:MarR family transcriptional regulator n=1 Tax=Dactylosporangium sucinum TaxID=1424081 RepID=A0A917TK91_9ACTN|nr:MarR family transcriptional regulator [Dactylosporangium sucinum]GGM26520.1 MarR family transcriptional regulator [Dactylosporangium sucinum]